MNFFDRVDGTRRAANRVKTFHRSQDDYDRLAQDVPVLCDIAKWAKIIMDDDCTDQDDEQRVKRRLRGQLERLTPKPPDPLRETIAVLRCPEQECSWEYRAAHWSKWAKVAYRSHYEREHGGVS